jgi:signal transduction histidine kinase/CheY-like chemotaxis protein/HPt (histidine-containing phosphotransfer) domain-containing protein
MQVKQNGRCFWLKTLANTRRTEEGGTLFNGVWLDISDIKAQAHALECAKEQAEQAAKAKSAFLATMSHEIRTPMNAIIGLTQLNLRTPLPPQQQQRLEKTLRASQHLLGIINDILDFSKIDGGHLQAEHIPFALDQLLDDVREMLAPKAEEQALTLHIQAPADLPVLLGDPLRISQILLNYADNALKFSEHGDIHLRLDLQRNAQGPTYLYGEVEDQGIGLSEEQMAQLFQPFQQADNSISRRFGGTGLGLAISRNLAQLLGGNVGVRSQLGSGSTFWFRVRVELAPAALIPTGVPPTPSPQALQGLRLLLVDDNELNRLVASELLNEAGIQTDQAHDGQHAIDLLHQAADDTYDAVLMDMMMPGLDGLSATRLLRGEARFAQLPIIAMTANASLDDVEQCLAAGMNAHVAKPIDEQRLWKALLQHCLGTPDGLPAEQPAAAAPTAIALDPQPLEHLRRLVSQERFARMLGMLIEDCQRRGELFAAIAAGQTIEPAQLRKNAHDLIGIAGHAGLKRLGQLARTLQDVQSEAADATVRQHAEAIEQACTEAVRDLRRHFS